MHEHIDGLYFFTATCLEWKPLLQSEQHQSVILESLNYFSKSGICVIYGFVIMPNHIHLLMGIEDKNIRNFQSRFMKFTSQMIIGLMRDNHDSLLQLLQASQVDRNLQFWERRPKWKSLITSSIFFQKLRYVHNNPLQKKWNLSVEPESYPLSSANSYKTGIPEFDFLTLYD